MTTETSWIESLPETFREAPFIKASKTPEEALAAIKNAADYMGNSIRIPGEDASDEARNEFYEKITQKAPKLMFRPEDDKMDQFYDSLGRPKDPKEYKFDLPEGKEIPADFESFSKIAHKNGLTNAQFKGILGEVLTEQWEAQESMEAAQEEEIKGLKTEWGHAFNDKMAQVKNFLKLADAPEGIVDLFTEGAMSAAEVKWLHGIATKMHADVELAKLQTTVTATFSPSEARDKIQEILNNPEHPYWVQSDPRHKDAIQKMIKLQEMANPD